MRHEHIVRTYHIHLPPGFKKAGHAPLVLVLHGGGGKGKTFDRAVTQGTLTAAADKRGVVLVFPEGVHKQWRDGRAEILKGKTYDDVGFISRIIDTMRDPSDGTHVEIAKYTGGTHATEVILVKVIGGGHSWPGGRQYLNPRWVGVVCRDINASDMILDFFLNHSRSFHP